MKVVLWGHDLPNPTLPKETEIKRKLTEYRNAGVDVIENIPGIKGVIKKEVQGFSVSLTWNDEWTKRIWWLIDAGKDRDITFGSRPSDDWTKYDLEDIWIAQKRVSLFGDNLENSTCSHELHKYGDGDTRDEIVAQQVLTAPDVPSQIYYGLLGQHEEGKTWLPGSYKHIAQISINDPQMSDWKYVVHWRETMKLLLERFCRTSYQSSIVCNFQHHMIDDKESKRLIRTAQMALVQHEDDERINYLAVRGCGADGRDKPLTPSQIEKLVSYLV